MLLVDSITNKASVLAQLNAQCPGSIMIAHGITDRAWRKLINGCMSDFIKKYHAGAVRDKKPVEVIGQQVIDSTFVSKGSHHLKHRKNCETALVGQVGR